MPDLTITEAIERLEELHRKATPRPWRKPNPGWKPPASMGMRDEYPEEGWHPNHPWDWRVNADALDCEEENGVAYQLTEEDADLIPTARNTLPALLAVAKAAQYHAHSCTAESRASLFDALAALPEALEGNDAG